MSEAMRDLANRITADHRAGRLRLPGFERVALRVQAVLADERSGMPQVARLVLLDPALSARLIQVANSAHFGSRDKMASCEAAMVRLGLGTVTELVDSFVANDLLQTPIQALRDEQQRLWRHAVQLSILSRRLAQMSGEVEPERAQLAALVCEIGAMPLLHYASRSPELVANMTLFRRMLAGMERSLTNTILRNWNFDEEFHALPERSLKWQRPSEGEVTLTDVLLLARALSIRLSKGAPRYRPPALEEIPAYGKFRFGLQGVDPLLEQVSAEIDQIKLLLK